MSDEKQWTPEDYERAKAAARAWHVIGGWDAMSEDSRAIFLEMQAAVVECYARQLHELDSPAAVIGQIVKDARLLEASPPNPDTE